MRVVGREAAPIPKLLSDTITFELYQSIWQV